MTKEEIINSIKRLKVYYPYYYNNITKEDAKVIVDLWLELFGDLDNCYMQEAINTWGLRNDKPPSIADLRKCIGISHSGIDIEIKNCQDEQRKNHLRKQKEILWKFLVGGK